MEAVASSRLAMVWRYRCALALSYTSSWTSPCPCSSSRMTRWNDSMISSNDLPAFWPSGPSSTTLIVSVEASMLSRITSALAR